MKGKSANRILVGLAVSAAVFAQHSQASTRITLDKSVAELSSDSEIKRYRTMLELNPIKPVVDQYQDALKGLVVSQENKGIDNMLLAATETAKDRESTDIGDWGYCHTACHGACKGACHGSRGWR